MNHEKRYNQFGLLNIEFYNINGIKNNKNKLKAIIEYAEEKKIDILELGETNIEDIEGKWATKNIDNYKSFWASSEENKKKGSGIRF